MSMKLHKAEKNIIGSKEYISFPELGKQNIIARIDTGAKTSSMHCERVWVQRINNKNVLCATLIRKHSEITTFSKFSLKEVKSSNGHTQIRYFINMLVQFGNDVFETEFTLTNRDKMNNPVLLGRKFLKNKFLVDVSKKFKHTRKIH